MKKFLIFITTVLVLSLCHIESITAQTYIYKTTEFAYKQKNDNGNWTEWTDWEDSNMVATINLDDDVVKIFSDKQQTYVITEFVDNYTDDSGGEQLEFNFIDQDGDKGSMRLRTEKNGNSQMYIDFANIMWVYNIKRVDN